MTIHTHYISILSVMVLMTLAGIYSARFIRTASDFSMGGGKIGSSLVGGFLIGAFIGGTSTVGTAQTAYQHGISAIWFTLGGGLGCIILALFLAKPMRARSVETIPQFLAGTYGEQVRPWVAIYTSVGMFIQVAAQGLAAVPILTSIFPVSSQVAAVVFTLALITYIMFGGLWGASLVGFIKLILIYAALFIAGYIVYNMSGGVSGFRYSFPDGSWLSLFPQGVGKELASGFSVIVGLISTQTYLQPVFAARDTTSARRGLLLAGVLIPLAGLVSTMIGMQMRVLYPDIEPASSLPLFLLLHLNPWIGGAALGTLLVSLFLTGSALTLGASTVLAKDIYGKIRSRAGDREMLLISRALVLLVGAGCLVFMLFTTGTLILKWAFLSMTLRGVTVFAPLAGAVYAAGRIKPEAGVWAVVIAPLLAMLWAFVFPGAIDPLYVGMGLSAAILIIGSRSNMAAGSELKRSM
ncbi:sodium:solute symporter family protein [Pelotomaculum propionicicum]|uniref:sodium:solute symporter family protein n=1 Tax=Pelotomaculum propionicicum TaxID=258475 RepID=UPI003B7DA3CE